MKSDVSAKLSALALTTLGIVWLLIAFVVTDFFDAPSNYIGAVASVLFALLIVDVYLLVFRTSPGRQAVEIGVVSLYYTGIYLVAALVVNTAALALKAGYMGFVLLAVNLVLVVGYITMLIVVERDTARLKNQLARMQQATQPSGNLSGKLGELLAMARDDAVRTRLLRLKEAVDYSNNISSSVTHELETKMSKQLDAITLCLMEQADTHQVMQAIAEAETTWKMRSNASSTAR